jgi:hypothetical protein
VSRYDPPQPKCRHIATVRVSSHEDLLAGYADGDPIASTLSCQRPGCLDDAKAWLWASTHRPAVHVIELRRKVRQ